MNKEIKEKLKIKIAISKIKDEEEIAMNKKGKFVFKNIGIAACTLMLLTGGVFATSKVIENIWKEPEKIENVTDQITEESKKENITEEQAKEVALNKLKEIGFNTNIVNTNHYKEMDSDTIIYRFNTEDNYEISINGKTEEFETIWNLNKDQQDCNIEITEEEANKNFGLTLKNGTGFIRNGETVFYSENGGAFTGTTEYTSEEAITVPSFQIFLNSSKNISENTELGEFVIYMQAPDPENAEIMATIRIFITLHTRTYSNEYKYESAITPGIAYGDFIGTTAHISDKSSFTAYYALYSNVEENI